MKRSECIKILSEFIGDLRNLEGLTDLEMAEDVLEAIEDIGFFPPYYLVTSGERNDHWINEWEKE